MINLLETFLEETRSRFLHNEYRQYRTSQFFYLCAALRFCLHIQEIHGNFPVFQDQLRLKCTCFVFIVITSVDQITSSRLIRLIPFFRIKIVVTKSRVLTSTPKVTISFKFNFSFLRNGFQSFQTLYIPLH